MSLSELLVGLFLSTLLGCLLLQQYAGLGQSSALQQTLFNHQFEQNLIARLLRDAIHRAGFLPCGGHSNFKIWDASQSIWIKKDALLTQSNQIIANYMGGNFQSLLAEHSKFPVVANKTGVSKNHTVLLTNCYYSELNRIESIQPYGRHFKVNLAYPSHFVTDEDSYIGRWHQDQFKFQQGTLLFGDNKKERLTTDITGFKVTSLRPNLIHISWQFKHLPPFTMTIWAPNAPAQ